MWPRVNPLALRRGVVVDLHAQANLQRTEVGRSPVFSLSLGTILSQAILKPPPPPSPFLFSLLETCAPSRFCPQANLQQAEEADAGPAVAVLKRLGQAAQAALDEKVCMCFR